MAVKKKKAVKKKSTGKQMITMEQLEAQMAVEAESDAGRVGTGSSGSTISISGGSFTFKEADLGEELDVVIVDFININEWYDRPYDPDGELTAAACCAVNRDDSDYMVPFDDSPVKQADECCECEYNEWGSAANGKGKMCGNKRKLLVVHPDELENDVDSIEVAYLRVSPTSIKNFDKYIKGVSKVSKRPSYGVITQMTFDEDFDYPVLEFKPTEVLKTVAQITKVQELRKMYMEDLAEAPDFSQYEEPVKKTKKKRATKKKSKLGRK